MTKPIKFILSVLLLILVANQSIAQENSAVNQVNQNTLVDTYYKLNVKAFQANSTIEDINRIFELFTDDFTYVHPKYGGTYTRNDLYKGYVRNQKNGMYNGAITDVKIFSRIVGLNAIVVKRIYIDNETKEEKDAKMTLFEFKEGKISKIFEYW